MAQSLSLRAAMIAALIVAAGAVTPVSVRAQPGASPPRAASGEKFAPFETVIDGLEKVVSTADGGAPLWDLYQDRETGRLLAVLPANFDRQLLMIACTVAGGDPEAGVMGPTHYVRWERFDGQLALVSPELFVRTNGDSPEAKASVDQLFTGTVMLSTPILAMAPGNRPVIDFGAVVTSQVGRFFGPSIYGGYGASLNGINPGLKKLNKAKAFPENLVIEYQAPASDGRGSLWLFGSGVLVLGLGVLVARRVGGTPPGPAAA